MIDTDPAFQSSPVRGCPVCGYDGVVAFHADGSPTYDICPCCRFESGVDGIGRPRDENFVHMRRLWLQAGGGWWSPDHGPAAGWDAADQLARLTVHEASEAGEAWVLELADDADLPRLAASGASDVRALWVERILAVEQTRPGGWQEDARRCFGPDRWPADPYVRAFVQAAIRCAVGICDA